jgi:hypothetical protein
MPIDPATATILAGILSSAPGLIQSLTGGAQKRRAREFGDGLTRPEMPIPQSSLDSLETIKSLSSGMQMPGYENFLNDLDQIMAGAGYQIDQAATTGSQAMGAITQASGQQMKSLNQMAGASSQDYQRRQQMLAQALSQMGMLENQQWNVNEMGDYMEKARASTALAGAGMQNQYHGASDIFGTLAAALPMLTKKGTEDTPGGDNAALIKSLVDAMGGLKSGSDTGVVTPGELLDAKKDINMPFMDDFGGMYDTPLYQPFGAGVLSENNSMITTDPSVFEEFRKRIGLPPASGFYNTFGE